MAVRTWSVAEICDGVDEVIRVAFPDQLWVRGEIQGYRAAPNGHVYFDLVDGGDSDGRPAAKVPVTLFRGPRRGVEAVLRKVGDLRLDDGVDVRIRGRVSYYPPQGRVQLLMDAVDPRHTLGRLAADRDRVLRALAAEGLVERNGRLTLPLVPLRIGLVTSDDSAAANDVLDELDRAGFGFEVQLVDARVQGADAVASLCAALAHLRTAPIDVVLLVRGGGARTDLVAFDDERVARAVATMHVPVVTGIGHEIDRAVVDEVAHTAAKTPTAAAGVVIERVRAHLATIDGLWAAIAERALVRLRRSEHLLGRDADRLRVATSGSLSAGLDRLDAAERRLVDDAHRTTRRADAAISSAAHRASALTLVRLRRSDDELEGARRRIEAAARRRLDGADAGLVATERLVRAVHPDRTLARGFALVERPAGGFVRSVADLDVGERIGLRLADGRAAATVESIAPDEEETP
ncbi:MAG: exodeoxyribonuclease VII large subunit [Actinomycetota bacterium]